MYTQFEYKRYRELTNLILCDCRLDPEYIVRIELECLQDSLALSTSNIEHQHERKFIARDATTYLLISLHSSSLLGQNPVDIAIIVWLALLLLLGCLPFNVGTVG